MENQTTRTISVRGIPVADVTLNECLDIIAGYMAGDTLRAVVTPNAEIAQMCVENTDVRSIITSADLIIPDGRGVVLASRILGTPLKSQTPGCELGELLCKNAESRGFRIYFLGGKPGVADLAEEKLREKYPGFHTAGTHDGYFKKEGAENDAVIEEINASGANLLFVCLGVPAQEKWIFDNRSRLTSVRTAIGLGGSLDCYAGTVKRAPKIFIRLGLEWFYRLCKQPSRIGRMMKLPEFIFGTVAVRLTGHEPKPKKHN